MTPKNPAQRRYLRRMSIATVVYVASLLGAKYLIEHALVSGPLVWPLAVVPGLAAAGILYAVGMLIVEQADEFQRMLLVRQVLVATGFAISLATVWGFLEMFLLVPHVEAFWILGLWCFGLFIGGVSNRITHGAWGQCW
ncbi:MAG: hypothetical protein ABIT16_00010 [Croceibacterium sp.]